MSFRGISAAQDGRFANKEAKLLKTMKFPPSFATPLDLARVNWEAVRPWVTERVTAILGGVEDDVLIEYLMEQLQGKEPVDPRLLQINLTGFLERSAAPFTAELWDLLASAVAHPAGMPLAILEAAAAKVSAAKAAQDSISARLAEAEAVVAARERGGGGGGGSGGDRARRWSPPRHRHGRRRSRSRSPYRRRHRSRSRSPRRRYRSRSRSPRRDRERRPGREGDDKSRREWRRSRSRSRERSPRRERGRTPPPQPPPPPAAANFPSPDLAILREKALEAVSKPRGGAE